MAWCLFLFGILLFQFRKMHLKMSSAKLAAILPSGRWVYASFVRFRYSFTIVLTFEESIICFYRHNQCIGLLWLNEQMKPFPMCVYMYQCVCITPGVSLKTMRDVEWQKKWYDQEAGDIRLNPPIVQNYVGDVDSPEVHLKYIRYFKICGVCNMSS